MANEISISLSIAASKNGAKFERYETFKDDMAGDSWSTGIVEIAASTTAITEVQVSSYGWIYLKNCGADPELYVEFAHDTAAVNGDDNICRLYGGESCILKASSQTALHAISSSGTQNVEYAIIEL